MHPFLQALDGRFHDIRYVAERHPTATLADHMGEGANCQSYAYAVVRHHGLHIAPLRSSELWADTSSTTVAEPPYRALDLLLVNGTDDAYGAHVGVFVSAGEVLHLCQEIGVPAVWTLAEFAGRKRYSTIVGVKRPLCRPSSCASGGAS